MQLRSGFVTILGRPNAGKSTLLNALVGEKIAIVTPKPQTTRNRIQGMISVPAAKGRPPAQIVLVDTPGVHKPATALNRKMMHEVQAALEGQDLVLLLVDATEKLGSGDKFVLDLVKRAGGKTFLLLNKVDLVPKTALLPLIDEYQKLHVFDEIIPISALKRDGLEVLLDRIVAVLPEGPRYFPDDQITDQPERFLAAEIIREKVLERTGEEVPYATTVAVEQWEESPKLTKIAAAIFVEREGWRDSREFVETLDWRRQLEDLATDPRQRPRKAR